MTHYGNGPYHPDAVRFYPFVQFSQRLAGSVGASETEWKRDAPGSTRSRASIQAKLSCCFLGSRAFSLRHTFQLPASEHITDLRQLDRYLGVFVLSAVVFH